MKKLRAAKQTTGTKEEKKKVSRFARLPRQPTKSCTVPPTQSLLGCILTRRRWLQVTMGIDGEIHKLLAEDYKKYRLITEKIKSMHAAKKAETAAPPPPPPPLPAAKKGKKKKGAL